MQAGWLVAPCFLAASSSALLFWPCSPGPECRWPRKIKGQWKKPAHNPVEVYQPLGVWGGLSSAPSFAVLCSFSPLQAPCFLAQLCPPQVPGLGLFPLQLFIFASTNFCAAASGQACVHDPGEQCLLSPQCASWCCTVSLIFSQKAEGTLLSAQLPGSCA